MGVPALRRILAAHGVKASFFFSVGPDNMGRHLWRLIRPRFLWKMLRTKAPQLYGWDILLKGTLWPGPLIGQRMGHEMKAVSAAGHEVGLHAWDHHWWQTRMDRADGGTLYDHIDRGMTALTAILGRPPVTSAAPAWKSNERVIVQKARFPFQYNSDCRGTSIFYPIVSEPVIPQVQIPVTLPTYDEVIGRGEVTTKAYNEYLLSLLNPHRLNVLTIHAEVEGIVEQAMFDRFLTMAASMGAAMVPLSRLLPDNADIGYSRIVPKEIEGREGWVCCQASEGDDP
ncbi:MAG: polysaccharide deacetylase family protein [Deltaproteobacteria bacterium]|nr:polysaccharide deacetylase family protein [Deltaproteobacteria bacterium]